MSSDADFTDFTDFIDINEVKTDEKMTLKQRKTDFVRQINPYKHKAGEITVTNVFSGDKPLPEKLKSYIGF